MQFDSFEAFIAMGGHGLYVWLCYGVGLLTLATLAISPRLKRQNLLRNISQKARREQKNAKNTS